MELFEKITANCEIRNRAVEILLVTLKKSKHQEGTRTPVRCMNANECPRSAFCRFVNPLTTRIPVNLNQPLGQPAPATGASAATA